MREPGWRGCRRATGRRVGLGDVRARDIDPIAELGFDLVWLTGGLDDRIGQPTSVAVAPSMQDRSGSSSCPTARTTTSWARRTRSAPTSRPRTSAARTGWPSCARAWPRAGLGLILDFVPNHTAPEHPWVRRHPDWYVHAETPPTGRSPDEWFEVRSEGRHWIAHGRDPNFPPWLDTAQLDYRHPEVPAGDDPDAARGRDALRRRRVLDGDARARRRLPVDLGRPVRAPRRRPRRPPRSGEFWWHASERGARRVPALPAHRRGLLGPRVAAPAARLRLHLRLDAARPHAERTIQRRSSPTSGRTTTTSAGRCGYLEHRDEPTHRRSRRARAGPGHGASSRRSPGMLLVTRRPDAGHPRAGDPVQFRREPVEPPDPASPTYYCRLLRATDDEVFRLGQAIRLEPNSAWPGQRHPRGHPRPAVGRPAPAAPPRRRQPERPSRLRPTSRWPLPEFAGKTVRLEDQLGDVVYDRTGDDLLTRGLYVDLPAYGGHLFRVTRQTPAGQRRRAALADARAADRRLSLRVRRPRLSQPSGASSSRA